MVIYFSTTGNTEYAAKRIAELLGDQTLDLLQRVRSRDHSAICSDRPFVICTPSYVCDIPSFLVDYLEKTDLTGCRDVYYVFTAGGYAGACGTRAKRISSKKGMDFRGFAELIMPNNYIASNVNTFPSEEEIRSMIRRADEMIGDIAGAIREGRDLRSRKIRLAENAAVMPVNPFWRRFMQPTKFTVDTRCTGCGLCAGRCPLNIITMIQGGPVWTERRCAHCMSCIQNCPVNAIEYGNITQSKPRYRLTWYTDKN